MPELPELEVYRENLGPLVVGRAIRRIEVRNVFTVRTFDPPVSAAEGLRVASVGRRDKHLYLSLDGGLHLVFHMRLAGRLRWKEPHVSLHARIGCLRLVLDHGALHLTEASTQKSASLHVVRQLSDCADLGRGEEPLELSRGRAREILSRESRQLKGALTDPRLLAGIGNAYSDEILFDARLSPLALTQKLDGEAWNRLEASIPRVLREWIARVRERAAGALPTEQGGWRRDMKVHGKFKSPCPRCGTRIERIAYADSETHYCPACQTGGRKLSDRRLDRLMRR